MLVLPQRKGWEVGDRKADGAGVQLFTWFLFLTHVSVLPFQK